MTARSPAVAGRFYPADPAVLARDVAAQLRPLRNPRPAVGVMVPHAGYVYSGGIAGETFASVEVPERVLVMAPNHTGRGQKRALFPGSAFALPGGEVSVAGELVAALLERTSMTADSGAHELEHAVEVELPFLRARRPGVRVAAACLAWLSLDECRRLGSEIARVLTEQGGNTLLVASSDMSHYLAAAEAEALDRLALARVLSLDAEGLYRTVTERDISMCGFIPTTVMLFAAVELGATSAELVRYGNSGERYGDYDSVVGYAGVIVQ